MIFISYNSLGDSMNINIINDDEIVVFLNKKYLNNLDFKDEVRLEDCIKNLFKTLVDEYDLDVDGYYIIDIYFDDNYGAILNIKCEEGSYYNYFDNQVDMKINIHKSPILYEINYDFLDDNLLKCGKIYRNKDKLYIKLTKSIDDINLGKIIEMSKIIYGNVSLKILNTSSEVRIWKSQLLL